MKDEDLDTLRGGMDLPTPENIRHQEELKIPLLSYKRSSRAGLWLLLLPVFVVVTGILKYDLALFSPFLDSIQHFFAAVQRSPFLTYFIPLMFAGLPLLAMMMNLLAICHFTHVREKREFIVTIKLRLLNIALFLFSFVVLVYFLLPDRLSF